MAAGSAIADEGAASKPRLLFFHSPRCGKCRRVEGYLAQVLQRRKNHGTFVQHRIDTDERFDMAERFRIDTVPTLVVVSDKRVRARLPQPRGSRQIEEFLAPWLASPGALHETRA